MDRCSQSLAPSSSSAPGTFEAVEGTSRQRNIVLEFPSYTDALDCWHSPEYQEVRKLRTDSAASDVIIIEGYDHP